ncbi:hypothetical protein LCGC14_2398500 [marine sediment metagenome]|uniref:Uncharacterized protein n=1 Tax=marine sediment metagenome TaxID=412755 RepID=A0A0F9EQF6_9ZZZZ
MAVSGEPIESFNETELMNGGNIGILPDIDKNMENELCENFSTMKIPSLEDLFIGIDIQFYRNNPLKFKLQINETQITPSNLKKVLLEEKHLRIKLDFPEEKDHTIPSCGVIVLYITLFDRNYSFAYGALAESYDISNNENSERKDRSECMMILNQNNKRMHWETSDTTIPNKKIKTETLPNQWISSLHTDKLELDFIIYPKKADSKVNSLREIFVTLKIDKQPLYATLSDCIKQMNEISK